MEVRLQDIFPSVAGSLITPRSEEAISSTAKVNETQQHIFDLNRKLTAGPCSFRADDIAWLLEVAYAATNVAYWAARDKEKIEADMARWEALSQGREVVQPIVTEFPIEELPEWLRDAPGGTTNE